MTTTRTTDHTHARTLTGEITNTCTCVTYNEDTGDWDEAPECWLDCWDYQVEDWTELMQDWVDNNPTGEWLVTNFPTWHGGVTGVTVAHTAEELLRAITVRSEWRMRWTLSTTTDATTQATTRTLECVLSHHDAPTGGRMTVTYAPVCD